MTEMMRPRIQPPLVHGQIRPDAGAGGLGLHGDRFCIYITAIVWMGAAVEESVCQQ